MATEFPIKKGHSKHPLPSPRPAGKHDRKMNLTQIQDLIKFVAKSGVSEVEIEQKDFKITIKTPAGKKEQPVQVIAQPLPQRQRPEVPRATHPSRCRFFGTTLPGTKRLWIAAALLLT